MNVRPNKLIGNWTPDEIVVEQVEDGQTVSLTIAPFTSATVPFSDSDMLELAAQAQAALEAEARLQAEQLEATWRELRAHRDTWLAACQVIFDEIKNPGFHDLSSATIDAIAAHSADWLEWRDAMRELPDANGIDPVAAAAAIASITATDQEWPTPWPTPPAAPVIHIR